MAAEAKAAKLFSTQNTTSSIKNGVATSSEVITEELRELWSMAVPITTMNIVVYLRSLISVLCLGRLGSLELAGGALSIGFTNITGYSVLFGLASGLEPFCSQAFGSKNYELISLSFQRTILLLLISSIPISLLWINLNPILLTLGQDESITSVAAIYCLYSLPDLLTNSFLQPLRVYLRSQKITKPMMWCSALAVLLHLPLNVVFVFVLGFGVPGVAMAQVMTNLNMCIFLVVYLKLSGACDLTWKGWDRNAATGLAPLVTLALPSCCGVCLEWWWYEIVTILAGYLENPKASVAATAILIQTTSLMYTFPMGLAACVSTRVGNEVGDGKPEKARLASLVAVACGFVIGTVHVVWTSTAGSRWASLFTDDSSVANLAAAAMPVLGLCELANCPQTTGCGVLRGIAKPGVAARINLTSFYLIGTPVALILTFGLGIGFGGLWYGLLVAQVACAVLVLTVVLVRTDWTVEILRAKKLTNHHVDDGEGKELLGSGLTVADV